MAAEFGSCHDDATRQLSNFLGTVMHQLGDDWETIQAAELFEMKLIVFARKSLHVQIGCIAVTRQGSTSHVAGNKGGIVVRSNLSQA